MGNNNSNNHFMALWTLGKENKWVGEWEDTLSNAPILCTCLAQLQKKVNTAVWYHIILHVCYRLLLVAI